MAILIVDGPEKAGKSTIIDAVARRCQQLGFTVGVRRWGQVDPDDRVYSPCLQEDARRPANDLMVWDRSWASEHVYGKLLGRDRRLVDDPWLGEWIHSRAVQTVGMRVMLLGPSVGALRELRDDSDLPVNPAEERALFDLYARRFGWTTFSNAHSLDAAERIANIITLTAVGLARNTIAGPPTYCGPSNAPVIFVGERRNEGGGVTIPGSWLPFGSRLTSLVGRQLGDFAMRCGWTNASDCPPLAVRRATVLVALGKRAEMWCSYHVGHRNVVWSYHPAYAFRYCGKPAYQYAVDHLTHTLSHIKETYEDVQVTQAAEL